MSANANNPADDLARIVVDTIRGELAKRPTPSPYVDVLRGAAHCAMSKRSFEAGPAREVACIRLADKKGKRLWAVADLDLWMAQHKKAPISNQQLSQLVADICKTFQFLNLVIQVSNFFLSISESLSCGK